MHLSPREIDKLLLHNAGFLAQKRLARGVRLNHPESVALIATQLLEFIRDGKSVSELMDLGRQFLGRNQVMNGVPEMFNVGVSGIFMLDCAGNYSTQTAPLFTSAYGASKCILIVQAGTNLSVTLIAEEMERELGKPVIPINVACVWHALRAVGLDENIPGFGSLLVDF